MAVSDSRPFYLNLFKIKLPIPGMVSIFHRITGVLMFLALPFAVYLLDLSLQGESGFEQVGALLDLPFIQFLCLVFLWSLFHHLFAGIRFLLIDFDIAVDKRPSQITAWLVFIAEAVAMGLLLLGVYL